MTTIPNTIEEITPGWLLDTAGLDCDTSGSSQIGVGIGVSSALYRVELTGDGCPASVVVKLPALDEAAVFTSTMLRMYIREVRFFEELAARVPVRVPAFHHGEVDEETSRFVVVMEDMSALRGVDQVEGMAMADAERAVDALARWHARFWGEAEEMAASGLTVHLNDPIYPAVLPLVFGEGWEKLMAEHELPDAVVAVGPRFSDAIAGLLADLGQAPTTLCHGDYRADNLLFDDDGELAVLDFQLIGTGAGAYDLAYFTTQSIRAEDAEAHERRPVRPVVRRPGGCRRHRARPGRRVAPLSQGGAVLPRLPGGGQPGHGPGRSPPAGTDRVHGRPLRPSRRATRPRGAAVADRLSR